MAVFEVSQKWTRHHLVLHWHPEMSFENEDPFFFKKDLVTFSSTWFGVKVDVLSAWSPS